MLDTIMTRRSIRKFTSENIDRNTILKIIEAGIWAPSGLNNQPWKFIVVTGSEIKNRISIQTKYSRIIQNAKVLIVVFLDNSRGYNRVKDIQAIGACIQNMLLAIHSENLGGVWLGEILNNREKVEDILEAPEHCELMAVIALGHPAEHKDPVKREPVNDSIIGWI